MRYRSKPTEVEAVRWVGNNLEEVHEIATGKFIATPRPMGIQPDAHLLAGVDGAQGWVDVPVGYFVVRNPGDPSDIWPVDPDYFRDKYEAAPTRPGDTDT